MPQKTATKKSSKKPVKKKQTKRAIKKRSDKNRKLLLTSDIHPDYIIPQETVQKFIDQVYDFGRPTSYKPDMCPQLVAKMATGRSFQNAVTMMGISYMTACLWIKQPVEDEPNPFYHEDFFYSYKLGMYLNELWWDEKGKQNLDNPKFNNNLYMMFRTNKHGWTRRLEGKVDVVETNHTIDEKRITINQIQQIGDEGLAEIARILIDAGAIKPAVQATAYAQGQ
jgi:hypothetical protein